MYGDFGRPLRPPSPSSVRWKIRLDPYNFTVERRRSDPGLVATHRSFPVLRVLPNRWRCGCKRTGESRFHEAVITILGRSRIEPEVSARRLESVCTDGSGTRITDRLSFDCRKACQCEKGKGYERSVYAWQSKTRLLVDKIADPLKPADGRRELTIDWNPMNSEKEEPRNGVTEDARTESTQEREGPSCNKEPPWVFG